MIQRGRAKGPFPVLCALTFFCAPFLCVLDVSEADETVF